MYIAIANKPITGTVIGLNTAIMNDITPTPTDRSNEG